MNICPQCKSQFEVADEERKLYDKFGFEPTGFCFECDQQNRLVYRNERKLYRRKCDFSGEDIISIYSPDKPYKVYKNDIWYGDGWEGLDYGRDFDFNRPFFEQMKELQLEVPRVAIIQVNCENSDYCNMCVGNKDSYLIFGGDFNDKALYGTLNMRNINSVDLDFSNDNELCYYLGDSIGCYGCWFTFDSKNCKNCYFISDCSNCTDCILCTNLTSKSFCIMNKQYSKEEYFKKKEEVLNGSYNNQQMLWQKFLELLENRVVKHSHMLNCQNSSGDYLKNCKNCHNCYDVSGSEDMKNVIFASKAKDCFNCSLIGDGNEICYNAIATIGSKFIYNSYFVFDCSNIEYCEEIYNSQNCFGCIGLRHKQYCIFNKQYSKEEYKDLRGKIVEHMKKNGEWGQFFPKDFSCFGYNESTAHPYYPKTKEQVLAQGFKWKDDEQKDYKPQTFQIPDNIKDVDDSVLQEVLICRDCNKNFKVIEQELRFYRQNNIPIPHKCSECRHTDRMNLRNPKKLYSRQCQNCSKSVQTTYAPDRPEKVYCENCYLKNIY